MVQDYDLTQRVIKEKDGRLAWGVLQARSELEYESYLLEHYEKIAR